jgi:thiol-disulfide isomerase/thioredoxin
MKLPTLLVLATAALATAQTPPKNASGGKTPAPASASTAGGHATLADLTKDFHEKKLAAIEVYVKTHANAADAGDAIVEAVELTQKLGRDADRLRYADLYLKQLPDGSEASRMSLARAEALAGTGDSAGAQKAYEALIDKAGDDVNLLVEAATGLGTMLVEQGKKDEATELANVVGASRPQVRGLKEHFARLVGTWQEIGSEPKPLAGKDENDQPIACTDIDGKPLDLAAYKGKVLLIDFWATWCGPCMQELPNVLAAYRKYHDKGFEILGISLDRDRAAFDKVVADRKMTWRHYYDGKFWDNVIGKAWGVGSIPATYLVGQDGKIVAVGLRGEQLEKRLEKLLGGAKPAAAKPTTPPVAPKK